MRDRKTAQDALQTYSHAMNHDLRNLVMGIANLVQGVLFRSSKGVAEADWSSQPPPITIEPKALSMIQQSCDRQLKLMSSLMDVQSADIWLMSLQLTSVNLQQLIADLTSFYRAKQLASGFRVNNRLPSEVPLVSGDLSQLRRVFENLIDNALKYNPHGVSITLTADVWEDDQSMIRCAVTDNGIGIESAKNQNLFKIYARGDVHAAVPGYGLGLYICRKIVEAHGGSIGVESPATGGAEFWFTLPL